MILSFPEEVQGNESRGWNLKSILEITESKRHLEMLYSMNHLLIIHKNSRCFIPLDVTSVLPGDVCSERRNTIPVTSSLFFFSLPWKKKLFGKKLDKKTEQTKRREKDMIYFSCEISSPLFLPPGNERNSYLHRKESMFLCYCI